MLGKKKWRMAIIKKIDVRVEIGMRDCLRNNDIYILWWPNYIAC